MILPPFPVGDVDPVVDWDVVIRPNDPLVMFKLAAMGAA